MGQLWTFVTYINTLAGPSITLLYPLYASIQALESPAKLDDEQWLAYWILYSFLTLTEMVLEPILKWVPIWYQMKVAMVAWLVLPQFRGAAFIYDRFVRKHLKRDGIKINDGGNKHSSSSSSPSSSSPKKKIKFMSFVTPKKGGHEAS